MKENIKENIPLANSILLCGISYLLGGNEKTQKNIIEELGEDEENKVLSNIKGLILKLGALIRQNIDEERANINEPLLNDFQITDVDNYDFYNYKEKIMERKNVVEERTIDENIYYQDCIITYRRAFKFLQLMCENNNI